MLVQVLDDPLATRSGMTALMERMTAAIFFVERSGRISYANVAGARMLAEGSVFRAVDRKLVAMDIGGRRLLEQALGGGDAEPLATTVATPEGRRTLSIIPPMETGGRCGVVMLATPDPEVSRAGPHLARAYGLTGAETRVLTALLGRRTPAQIAADLGVTPRTVKAHLQKLFEKTGTRRQCDLVGEVLALIPPMRLN